MTSTSFITAYLAHYGVKGQKWGVRKDRGHEGEQAKTKDIAKLDKKFEAKRPTQKLKLAVSLHNRAADLSNVDLAAINKKYEGNDFHLDSPVRQKYYAEVKSSYMKNLQKAADEMGTNASGTKRYRIQEMADGAGWNVYAADIEHADEEPFIAVRLVFEDGFITNIQQNELLHEDIVLTYLAHHGVKGQRWGVRRSKAALARQAKREGREPPSEESARTRELLKKSRDSLTNKELKEVNERLNLEQNFNRLNPNTVSRGKAKTLATLATISTVAGFIKSPAGQLAIKAGSAAASRILLNVIPVPMKRG